MTVITNVVLVRRQADQLSFDAHKGNIMPINASQLRLSIIRPVLQNLGLWSQAAENLLMGTAAQESGLGTYVEQLGGGPARGIFQMEPATLNDCYVNFLDYRADLKAKIDAYLAPQPDKATQLATNNAYAAAMCRVRYMRVSAPLPDASDIAGLAAYWKQYYNTAGGKGETDEFVANYNRYVGNS
ncbi:hypothetical protein ABIE64_003455 [Thalassospira sp. MBR-102]|nr:MULTISPECIES: hypothetical protein [Thalassospira]OCK09372.1 hypothetical protein KO164_3552 [Thalassospira sp. KO164]PXX32128.1 hypothetical protein C7967_105299 [Thalassospira sp. 11-3]SEE72096.1 hypothetical protein SAMN04515623_3591 [Thalassospira permensis]